MLHIVQAVRPLWPRVGGLAPWGHVTAVPDVTLMHQMSCPLDAPAEDVGLAAVCVDVHLGLAGDPALAGGGRT